jgi:hypothetical protein
MKIRFKLFPSVADENSHTAAFGSPAKAENAFGGTGFPACAPAAGARCAPYIFEL